LPFAVLEAASGEEARILVRETPAIAVVFSNIQMPGRMDGSPWRAGLPASVKVLLTSGRIPTSGVAVSRKA
jgi:CheY-like chemotaxis protein